MQRLYYLLLVGVVFLSACRKEKFSSESNWVAPLLQTKLDLGDILPDSITQEGPNGELTVVFEEEYGVSNLEDILEIPDRVEEIEVSLTSLVLDDRSFTDTLTLLEIYPASVLLNGQTTELGAQDITSNEGTVLDVTEQFFTTATFKEGYIDISISNDLPVEAEVLEFELRNDDDKEAIVSGVFTNLAPGTTVQETYDLAGLTVDGVLELIVKRVKTKASNGEVLIDVTNGIRTTITVRGLKPLVATAIFPAQNLVEQAEETKYDFGGAELTQVYVKSGDILMKVESSIDEAIILDYKIPNSFKTGESGIIEQNWVIPPAPEGEVVYVEERFPIDGFVIYLWGESQSKQPNYNLIYNELIARIDYSGLERTLSLEDKIKIEFGLVNVMASLVIGDPGRHDLSATDTLSLDALSKLEGNINLEDARVDLNFYNSFGIESLVDVQEIRGLNSTSNKVVNLVSGNLLKDVFLERATNPPLTAFQKEIVLDNTSSNLKLFLQNLPHKVIPSVTAKINPNGTLNQSDFAFDMSELTLNFKLTVPMHFGLDSLNLRLRENIALDKEQLDNIKEGKLILTIENDFPIEAGLSLDFVDEQGRIVLTKTINGENMMAAAEVDATTGKTVAPAESEVIIALNRNEMDLFKVSDGIDFNVFFNTKEAKRYKMYSDYEIDIKLGTNFTYENQL
ncbi:MAG: hypothetical protein P8N47_03990 [Bacteroidia bacterium]|jgi:hypothetical protein|nr:hypothetical protein [Bacteroidia bacterium]